MVYRKKRGLFGSLGAVVAAAALVLSGATGAQAQQQDSTAPEASDVVITKLPQPAQLGDPADGTQLDSTEGIEGVAFEAYLVEGTQAQGANDIGTNRGQQWVAGLDSTTDGDISLAETPERTGTTNAEGVLNWPDMPRGLYVVTEADAPSDVLAADDFFLSVPLTNPDGDGWLDTIYVYPKNAQIDATKSVNNADAYTAGDTVTWTIDSAIPRVPNPRANGPAFVATDAFEIHDTLDNSQLAVTASDVLVTSPEELSAEDYSVNLVEGDGTTTVEISFSETGLESLASAVNADVNARVTVEIITEVLSSGQITNGAEIYPNAAATANAAPLEVAPAEIRYGGYLLNKVSSDDSLDGEALAGAEFRVYLSEEAAEAGGDNYLTTASNPEGLWTTTSGGTVLIDGLRYSGWANDQSLDTSAAEYQTYWLVETQALTDHQQLAEPVSFIVDETSSEQSGETIVNVPTSAGGFELPLTGGMGTVFLTVLGLAILATVVIVARRRRAAA